MVTQLGHFEVSVNAWQTTQELERRWVNGEFGSHAVDRSTWINITGSYWRKEISTPQGIVIAEVVEVPMQDGFIARARKPDIASDFLMSGESFPLAEAQREGEELAKRLTRDNIGAADTDIMIPWKGPHDPL
ncbi:MAG TPA: hypothetical protein VKY74_25430 [Chloroflexia bacterium]|nr:hypothetical protein [Chloroflexia bacterium]